MFVPARLRDNLILLNADPLYAQRLKGLSSETMVRAWLEGDWTVVEGAFFDCWSYQKHVVDPFPIPPQWTRFRSMDWGSARPFSVGWWAIVQDDYPLPSLPSLLSGQGRANVVLRHDATSAEGARRLRTSDQRVLPRGALVRYREWYGASGINQGLKLDATQVAEGIVARERDDTLRYGVLDPACFREDGGPSIGERINAVLVAAKKRPFHAADNARVPQRGSMGGWDQLRARLVGQDGVPMIYTFSTCDASIRTIPALAHDQSKPEDVDTEGEDHAGDEWRYACMSRPFAAVPESTKKPLDTGYITHRQPIAEDWVSF